MSDDALRLMRRAPSRPLVWLGEKERASFVAPRLGARFPATATKERDLVLDLPTRLARKE